MDAREEKTGDEADKLVLKETPQAQELIMETTPATQGHVTINTDTNQTYQMQVSNITNGSTELTKTKLMNKGAYQMAGFMFWTNTAAVLLLLIGFATPGWLAIRSGQELYYSRYSSYDSGDRLKYTFAYQDYALWYITQCSESEGETICMTMSYRTVKTLFSNQCNNYGCSSLEIGSMRIKDASSLMFFSDAALAFSYSDIVLFQTLYTLGLILALGSLSSWYKFRRGVSEEKVTGLSKKKWICLFFLGALSALFVFLPVFEFASLSAEIRGYSSGDDASPVGVVFAGFGGGMMVLGMGAILMHLVCCRNKTDVYLCTTENSENVIVGEEEEV